MFQSIGFIPLAIKNSLVLENGLLPKNPLYAENGDGWADSRTKCLGLVINFYSVIIIIF